MAAVHRHLCIFTMLDMLIFALLMYRFAMVSGPFTEFLILLTAALICGTGLVLALRFRARVPSFDHRIDKLLTNLAVFFLVVGALQAFQGISDWDISLVLRSGLLVLLGFATRRRIATLHHPMFVDWYGSGKEGASNLSLDEVYASCPSCSSLLAVIPSRLSRQDRCPNCDGLLVTISEEE
jgi:hypothetical protein